MKIIKENWSNGSWWWLIILQGEYLFIVFSYCTSICNETCYWDCTVVRITISVGYTVASYSYFTIGHNTNDYI